MASRVESITHYTDDIDGGKADGSVTFSFDGANYEIDLSKKNRAALTKALAPYIDAARNIRTPRGRGTTRTAGRSSTSSAESKARLQAIRDWAKANGIEVADRGRISQAVQDQYDTAQ